MATKSTSRVRVAALILSFVGLALAASAVQVSAQTGQAAWAHRETPAAALDRHIRVLAKSPKDFRALIGAGNAALELGDTHAAVGFFGRADEVFPTSPLPHIGMGAASVSDGDAYTALRYFTRAQQLGANGAMLGAHRGLAYDLLGRHSDAQGDYRAAMYGTEADEARRRLALSLAITGDKDGALEMLAPLMARGDAGAARCRALVLALAGDLDGARRSLDARMAGSSLQMAPFLAKLPSLRSDQKAAAVNLGIFPNTGQPAFAYAPPQTVAQSAPSQIMQTPTPQPPVVSPQPGARVAGAVAMSGDRLASVDQLLRSGNRSRSAGAAQSSARPRVWVQLASGRDPEALPGQFRRIKTRHRDLLEGISGYVAESPERSRLLIGPFKDVSDANIFVADLESVRVDAFSWTSPAGQMIRKLPTE